MTAACDSSLLVPALAARHPDHQAARSAMESVTAIPAHVLLETYSVLTRLPAPLRISTEDAARAVGGLKLELLDLSAERVRSLVADCARHRIGGAAIYDALVGATAREHDVLLLTRDRRARPTYDAIGASYSVV